MFLTPNIPQNEERISCRPGEHDQHGAHGTDTDEHCLDKNVIMDGGGILAPNVALQIKKMPKNNYRSLGEIPDPFDIESNTRKDTDLLAHQHQIEFSKDNKLYMDLSKVQNGNTQESDRRK